jgi:hypothetical protein
MEHWEVLNNGQQMTPNDAEELWEVAASYFKWCDDNPVKYKRAALSGKQAGQMFEVTATRPYTLRGLCMQCGITEDYLIDCITANDKASLYYQVAKRIQYVIHTQNLENAMVGIFNPIMTAKVLNLEKEEAPVSTVRVEMVGGLPELANSENEILEKLNSEKRVDEIGDDQNP